MLSILCPLVIELIICAESQPYRYAFLAVGMLFLLVAPEVSAWVPFYYGSAMTLGVFLVILILLYQVLVYNQN